MNEWMDGWIAWRMEGRNEQINSEIRIQQTWYFILIFIGTLKLAPALALAFRDEKRTQNSN